MDSDFIFSYVLPIAFFIPLVLFVLSIVGIIVGSFMKKQKLKNISMCLAAWLTLFPIFPVIAKKSGVIKNILYGWLLALLSPPMLVFYTITYLLVQSYQPVPYKDLKFTSHKDIAAITETPNFPEFEYIDNDHDGWTGETYIHYKFKDENESVSFYKSLSKKLESKDNVYWSKDSLKKAEDKAFYDCDVVYIFHRGWYGDYVVSPRGIKEKEAGAYIVIGKKKFMVKAEPVSLFYIEDYANPDSLQHLTGIRFPKYKIVNCTYYGYGIDPGWSATMKLKEKPSRKFIEEIKHAEHWTERSNGEFQFSLIDRKGDLLEDITVNPNSQYVEISVSSH